MPKKKLKKNKVSSKVQIKSEAKQRSLSLIERLNQELKGSE